MRTGPFKILVMTTTLEFTHDSIPTCLTMLQALGKANAPERAKIAGLAADTTWTVDQISRTIPRKSNYFSEVTADNLKNYEMFYSNNPTGAVFTNAPSGAQKKQIFVDYWNNGGAWAGQHSAIGLRKQQQMDVVPGQHRRRLVRRPRQSAHARHGEPQTDQVNHPIIKGLPSPWSTSDEWYVMNRNIEAVPGFKILAKVTVTQLLEGNDAAARRLGDGERERQGRPRVLHHQGT